MDFKRLYLNFCRYGGRVGFVCLLGLKTGPHLYPEQMLTLTKSISGPPNNTQEKHQNLLKSVCQHLHVNPESVSLVYTKHSSAMSAGSVYLPNKAIVGLPYSCTFRHRNDITNSTFKIAGSYVDIRSKTGKEFVNNFLLDENEIKFLIAHELTHVQNNHFMISTAHNLSLYYGFFTLGRKLPSLLKMHALFDIFFVNIVTWVFGYLIFAYTRKLLSHYMEFQADENAAKTGAQFADGGVSRMRKEMTMNRMYRQIHGYDGWSKYSKIGNNLSDVVHPKLSDRLKRLKAIQRTYNSN